MSDDPISFAEHRKQMQARAAEAARAQARAQTRADPNERPKPWLSWVLFGLNLAVWLVMVGTGVDAFKPTVAETIQWGANLGLLTLGGEWWRLLTAMFLHGGFVHLAFNLYFLWAVGRACEQIFGAAAYGVVYIGSGLIASLASAALNPLGASVGASGALFGIFGALLGFVLRRRSMLNQDFVRSIARNAGVLVLINVAISFAVPEIDIVGHIAGALAGFGLGYLISALAEVPVETPQQAKRVRLRAIGAAVLATVVVLGAGILGAPRWDNPIATLERLGSQHDALMERYADADPAARAELIGSEILPFMKQAASEMSEQKRVPPQSAKQVQQWARYFELQHQAFTRELDGLRNNDEVALAEAEDLHAEAMAALED